MENTVSSKEDAICSPEVFKLGDQQAVVRRGTEDLFGGDFISSRERSFPSSLARWMTNPLQSSLSLVDGSLLQKLKADRLHGEPIAG